MATVWNDFVQGLIMLVGIVIILIAVMVSFGGFGNAINELSAVQSGAQSGAYTSFFGPDLYGLIMVVILTSLGTWGLPPQMVQKFYSVKTDGGVKKGMIISTVFALIVAGGCYFLGGFGRLVPGVTGADGSVKYDEIVPTMIKNLNQPVIMALVLVLVVAASMSTLSSLVMSSSSTITLDIIKGRIKKDISHKGQMLLIRIFVAVFIVHKRGDSDSLRRVQPVFHCADDGRQLGRARGGVPCAVPVQPVLEKDVKNGVLCMLCVRRRNEPCRADNFLLLGSLPEAFAQSFIYRYVFSSSIYVGVWTMIAGFVIVPVVSLFTSARQNRFSTNFSIR